MSCGGKTKSTDLTITVVQSTIRTDIMKVKKKDIVRDGELMSSENERKEFNKNKRGVDAWRRPPDHPEWSVNVYYGDGGYEVDAGTFGENKETALKEIDEAVKDLKEMKERIEHEL